MAVRIAGTLKTCSKCKQQKRKREFGVNRSEPDNLQSFCRDCFKKRSKVKKEELEAYYKQLVVANAPTTEYFNQKRTRFQPSPNKEAAMKDLGEGMTVPDCAAKFGLSQRTVKRYWAQLTREGEKPKNVGQPASSIRFVLEFQPTDIFHIEIVGRGVDEHGR